MQACKEVLRMRLQETQTLTMCINLANRKSEIVFLKTNLLHIQKSSGLYNVQEFSRSTKGAGSIGQERKEIPYQG